MAEPVVRARGLNHVGILTGDLDQVRHVLGDLLGLEVLWVMAGGVRLEFVRPTAADSRAAQAIAAGQGGVHHIALTVDDAAAALERLRAAGVETRDEVPRRGVHGSRIGFLSPGSVAGTLVEVVEEGRP